MRSAASVALAAGFGLDAGALAGGAVLAWPACSSPRCSSRRSHCRAGAGRRSASCCSRRPRVAGGDRLVGFRNCDYAIIGARLGRAQAGFYWRAFQLAVEYQSKVTLIMS